MSNLLEAAARSSEGDAIDGPATLLPTDQPPLPLPEIDTSKRLRKSQWKAYCEVAKKHHIANKLDGEFNSHKLLKELGIRPPVSRYRVSAPRYSAIDVDCVDEQEAIRRFYDECKKADADFEPEMVKVPTVTNIEHLVELDK